MRFRAAQILGLSLVLVLAFGSSRAQGSQPSEYEIKAAFLFNFAKFVEWPLEAFAEPTSPFVIGIFGENTVADDFERTIRAKTVNNRSFIIKEIGFLPEARNCHILFINSSEKKRFSEIFESLRGVSVLTVGETERFVETGGIINFVKESDKIRLQINEDAAKSAGLKISSKLLSLALRAAP